MTVQSRQRIFLFFKAIQVIFCSSYEFLMAAVYFQREEILKKHKEFWNSGIGRERITEVQEGEHNLHGHLGPCGRHSIGGWRLGGCRPRRGSGPSPEEAYAPGSARTRVHTTLDVNSLAVSSGSVTSEKQDNYGGMAWRGLSKGLGIYSEAQCTQEVLGAGIPCWSRLSGSPLLSAPLCPDYPHSTCRLCALGVRAWPIS